MHRIARTVIRHPRIVTATWLLLTLAALGPSSTLMKHITNGGYEVPGSDSARAAKVLEHNFHIGPAGVVVLVRTPQANELNYALLLIDIAASKLPVKVTPSGPLEVSKDGTVAQIPLSMRTSLGEAQKRLVELEVALRRSVAGQATVSFAGQVPKFHEFSAVGTADLSRAETLALPIAGGIILIAFFSVVAAGLPIVLALVAILIDFAFLAILSHVVDLSVFVSNTATMLGLALSIDYSLFMVTRYREEVKSFSVATDVAVERALLSAGRAIVVSGAVVAVALLSLAVLGVGIFTSMALGAAFTAVVASSVAVSLVPALLCLLGPRLDTLRIPRPKPRAGRREFWPVAARFVADRPTMVVAASLVVLVAFAAIAVPPKVSFAGPSGLPKGGAVREASDLARGKFGAGDLTPLVAVIHGNAAAVAHAASEDRDIAAVNPVAHGAGGWNAVRLVPRIGVGDPGSEAVVERLRSALNAATGHRAYLGGEFAESYDLLNRIRARLPAMLLVAALLALLVLIPVFRSVVVPVKTVLTAFLSVGATLGIVSLLLRWTGGPGSFAYFLPPLLFAIVFGLALDYSVFYLMRTREEYVGGQTNREAVIGATVASGRAITLAAVVMATVFAAFTISGLVEFQEFGACLAIAVILDATLVRTLLVPGLMHLFNEWNWWPGVRRHDGRPRATPHISHRLEER